MVSLKTESPQIRSVIGGCLKSSYLDLIIFTEANKTTEVATVPSVGPPPSRSRMTPPVTTFTSLQRPSDNVAALPTLSALGDRLVQAQLTLREPPFSANRPQIFFFYTVTSPLHTPQTVFVMD